MRAWTASWQRSLSPPWIMGPVVPAYLHERSSFLRGCLGPRVVLLDAVHPAEHQVLHLGNESVERQVIPGHALHPPEGLRESGVRPIAVGEGWRGWGHSGVCLLVLGVGVAGGKGRREWGGREVDGWLTSKIGTLID